MTPHMQSNPDSSTLCMILDEMTDPDDNLDCRRANLDQGRALSLAPDHGEVP